MGITTFAQNFEDVMLWRGLQDVDHGFFIDVGAHDPVSDSVSKAFSDRGWRGIHVEPLPYYADLLRRERPEDIVIQAMVCDAPGACEFYDIPGTGLSTSRMDIAGGHEAHGWVVNKVVVVAITLDDLFDQAPDEIHWLKIDVEGAEAAVMRGWKRSQKRPWVVVVEATYPSSQTSSFADWEDLILEKDYHHIYSDGLNRFYLSNNQSGRNDLYRFPPNIFDGFQMTEQANAVRDLVSTHQDKLAQLEAHCAHLEAEIERISLEAGQGAAALRADNQRQLDESLAREQQARLNTDQAIADSHLAVQAELDDRQRRLDEAHAWLRETSERIYAANLKTDALRGEIVAREAQIRVESDRVIASIRGDAQAKLDAVLENIQAALAHERTRCEVAEAALAIERVRVASLAADLKAAQTGHKSLSRSLSEILGSRSWRFAAPLRLLFGERESALLLSKELFQWFDTDEGEKPLG